MKAVDAESVMRPWILKYGPDAIAQARLHFNANPPGARRMAWMLERFGRDGALLESDLHLTTRWK